MEPQTTAPGARWASSGRRAILCTRPGDIASALMGRLVLSNPCSAYTRHRGQGRRAARPCRSTCVVGVDKFDLTSV